MMGNPEKLIEQYLDRVRVYLPLDSEDTLAEIRTHLLEEAETIGQGTVTSGSIMMAIERFGEPTRVANEYAGTGEKTGPIPTAYVQPILRILAVLVGVSAAFLVGAFIVGQVFPDFFGTFSFFPWFIPFIVVINILFAFMIVAGITMFDEKDPTERTALEGIFGIGTEAFKPKSRGSAAGDAIGGVIFVIALTLPAIQLMFTPLFAQLTGFLAVIFMIGAVKGTLFFFGGENNITLGIEALESGIWVFFSMFLINISWPIENAWAFVNGQWVLGNLPEFLNLYGLTFIPFDLIWVIAVWFGVISGMWLVIVSIMKISMYLKAGRGIWWKGTWGEKRYQKRKSLHPRLISDESS